MFLLLAPRFKHYLDAGDAASFAMTEALFRRNSRHDIAYHVKTFLPER
jgi:hypothetical protein